MHELAASMARLGKHLNLKRPQSVSSGSKGDEGRKTAYVQLKVYCVSLCVILNRQSFNIKTVKAKVSQLGDLSL